MKEWHETRSGISGAKARTGGGNRGPGLSSIKLFRGYVAKDGVRFDRERYATYEECKDACLRYEEGLEQ